MQTCLNSSTIHNRAWSRCLSEWFNTYRSSRGISAHWPSNEERFSRSDRKEIPKLSRMTNNNLLVCFSVPNNMKSIVKKVYHFQAKVHESVSTRNLSFQRVQPLSDVYSAERKDSRVHFDAVTVLDQVQLAHRQDAILASQLFPPQATFKPPLLPHFILLVT